MSFTWNAFGPVNLCLDVLIVAAACAITSYHYLRWGPPPGAGAFLHLRTLFAALVVSGLVWVPVVFGIRGIIGYSLGARVCWTVATVAAPILLLFLSWRYAMAWPVFVALVIVGIKYYGEVWEPSRLEVQPIEVRIKGLTHPVKITHISDLQTDGFGRLQEEIQAASNAFAPDLIVFTGDLINHPTLATAAGKYLAGFNAGAGKYFITGDIENGYDLAQVLAAGGFELLDGKAKALDVKGAELGLFGVSIHQMRDPALVSRLASELTGIPRILLSHRPDAILLSPEGTADLFLSGHTHGGQVCFPLIGPVVTLTRVPRRIAAGGLHAFRNAQIVVTRGLGWEGHVAPRVRTLCRPHLVLLTLVPA